MRSLDIKIPRQPKELNLGSIPEFESVDLVKDDVVFNVITSETAMKKADGRSWRGPKEKSDSLLHLFVTSLCPRNGVIVDLTTGTGEHYSTYSCCLA